MSPPLPPTTRSLGLTNIKHLLTRKFLIYQEFLKRRPNAQLTPNFQATLLYYCLCSNNVTPNATEYSQTIPYFTCTETNNQCVLKCNGDSTCQNNCRVQNPCGAQDPKRVNVTTTTAKAATTTATATPVNTLVNGATGAAPHMASVDMSHVYGLCVLVGGFVAGFATLL